MSEGIIKKRSPAGSKNVSEAKINKMKKASLKKDKINVERGIKSALRVPEASNQQAISCRTSTSLKICKSLMKAREKIIKDNSMIMA